MPAAAPPSLNMGAHCSSGSSLSLAYPASKSTLATTFDQGLAFVQQGERFLVSTEHYSGAACVYVTTTATPLDTLLWRDDLGTTFQVPLVGAKVTQCVEGTVCVESACGHRSVALQTDSDTLTDEWFQALDQLTVVQHPSEQLTAEATMTNKRQTIVSKLFAKTFLRKRSQWHI